MRTVTASRNGYSVTFSQGNDGILCDGGHFGALRLDRTPLFYIKVRRLSDRYDFMLTNGEGWRKTRITQSSAQTVFYFMHPECGMDLTVALTLTLSENGIRFDTELSNLDPDYSILEASYPIPQIATDRFDLFFAKGPGRIIEDFRRHPFAFDDVYPSIRYSMQYLAFFAEGSALYVGHHDREGRTKQYRFSSKDGVCRFEVVYPAEAMGLGANSFSLRGGAVWEHLLGDWYDVALRYASFAHTADWMPRTPMGTKEFRELPFWIMDFLPNIPSQGDNMPESLRCMQKRDPDAWCNDAIRLQKTLGVPVGYHVYNWHKNAFNIDYPHFLPAKDGFAEGVARLKAHNILVAPYINAVSWESRDEAPEGEPSFSEVGCHCAAKDENGNYHEAIYPQVKPDGKTTHLVPICPTTPQWQKIMERLSRRMEQELGINGIYYDESAAHAAYPCTDPTHPHAPGNGGFWVEGIRAMMQRIRAEMPKDNFCFTEANAEPYLNAFDGFLTWYWGDDNEVPAFPAIYSRHAVMLGRTIGGKKKSDDFLYRYSFAVSFLFGQQLGWCNCDIQDDARVFPFVKALVQLRYQYRTLFLSGTLLRPPKVTSDLPLHYTTPHLWNTDDITMPSVVSGAWKDGETVHLFLFNADTGAGNATLICFAKEYGIDVGALPDVLSPYATNYDPDTDRLTLRFDLKGLDILHLMF